MAVMDRRELLQLGAAALAAGSFAPRGLAQSATPAVAAAPKKIRIDAYSRTLHWLRTPEQVAEACHQIGNTTIDLTVRTLPGHVQPDKVKTDLPVFVKALEKNGITVTSIAADISDAKTPYAEDILGTMAALGIRHHWWRGMGGFDNTKPYGPQIEALKPRLAALVALEEKYGTRAMYHPQGGPFFDYLELIKNFDPKFVSLHFDTGHWMQVSQSNMASMIMWAGPYVGGFVWKDEVIEKVDPAAEAAAGGARAGRAGGGNVAAAPTPAPAAAGAAAATGRGQAAGAAQAGAAEAPEGARQGGRGGGGRGGGRGGSVNGFRTRQVPVGTGMVDFALAARALSLIGFDGPTECQPEWTGLGGAESGRDTLTLPRETVIGLLKRDYDTIHAALVAAGVA